MTKTVIPPTGPPRPSITYSTGEGISKVDSSALAAAPPKKLDIGTTTAKSWEALLSVIEKTLYEKYKSTPSTDPGPRRR